MFGNAICYHLKVMTVTFNYFENLEKNRFLLKHLQQEYLYLIIEYDAEEPSFFKNPDDCSSLKIEEHILDLKWFKKYESPSETIEKLSAMPWGAYVLTTKRYHHIYHFVYEISDPQGQGKETALLYKAMKDQNPEALLTHRLSLAYQHLFLENIHLGQLFSTSLKSLKLIPSNQVLTPENHILRIPIKLGEKLTFEPLLDFYTYDLFTDHLSIANLSPPSPIQIKLFDTHATPLVTKTNLSLIDFGILQKRSALYLELKNTTDTLLAHYTLLIRTGDPKEKYWDQNISPPFLEIKSLTWEKLPEIIKKNMLTSYNEDLDLFWDDKKPLSFNFYLALILQKLKWEEVSFQNYIQTSFRITDPKYYLYETDPQYSSYFHLYYASKIEKKSLANLLEQRFKELNLKPLELWSSIDAIECLNFCYILEKEKTPSILKLTEAIFNLFQSRLSTNPKATATHLKDSKIHTLSPQGIAVLALIKGGTTLKRSDLIKLAKEQMDFLLEQYPLQKQKFVENAYDNKALVHTAQALQKISTLFPEFNSQWEEAKKKILEQFKNLSPSLSTHLEILDLTTKSFYCYF